MQDGFDAMKRMAEGGPLPTVIFAAADRIALGAMNYLLEQGVRIPGDISVMGFDDIDMASVFRPKLSSVHYSSNEIGVTAMRNLMKLIRGESIHVQHTEVPYRIVVRESLRAIEP